MAGARRPGRARSDPRSPRRRIAAFPRAPSRPPWGDKPPRPVMKMGVARLRRSWQVFRGHACPGAAARGRVRADGRPRALPSGPVTLPWIMALGERDAMTRPPKRRCRCNPPCDVPDCECRPARAAAADPELHELVTRCVCRVLGALPPDMAEVFRRAEIDGQCCACIAYSLGVSPRTVLTRLRTARRAVLDRLAPEALGQVCGGKPSSPRH